MPVGRAALGVPGPGLVEGAAFGLVRDDDDRRIVRLIRIGGRILPQGETP